MNRPTADLIQSLLFISHVKALLEQRSASLEEMERHIESLMQEQKEVFRRVCLQYAFERFGFSSDRPSNLFDLFETAQKTVKTFEQALQVVETELSKKSRGRFKDADSRAFLSWATQNLKNSGFEAPESITFSY